ncbi:cytochrome P450 [Obba rivulosa]|uniref:Cytochrome P450 n=1 Tax=Obba rivulosa TaxID=1052685 RepID=A0A8E2APW8_9APHY|nr:cytochrome P450 [Obba rivulosa]
MLLQMAQVALIPILALFVFVLVARRVLLQTRTSVVATVQLPPLVQSRLWWIGSTLRFIYDPSAFFQHNSEIYGSIYRFCLGGRYMTVVSDPAAIVKIHSLPPAVLIPFEYQQIHRICGLAERVRFISDVFHNRIIPISASLLAKHRMSPISTAFSTHLLACFDSLRVPQHATVQYQLPDLMGECMYRASTLAFFGPSFPADTWADFAALDEDMSFLLRGIPLLDIRAKRARERICRAMQAYIRDTWQEDGDGYLAGTSEAMSAMLLEALGSGMTEAESARLMVSVLWGMNGSMIQVTQWCLAYIVADKALLEHVSDTVRLAVERHFADISCLPAADPRYLDQPDFAILQSIVDEVLRLSTLTTAFREVVESFEITGYDGRPYIVPKGDLVALDVRSIHINPVFFTEPHVFKADRFLSTEGQERSYGRRKLIPWGGGKHMCKGRHFAEWAVKTFLIMFLCSFDVETSSHPTSPASLSRTGTSILRLDCSCPMNLRRRVSCTQH